MQLAASLLQHGIQNLTAPPTDEGYVPNVVLIDAGPRDMKRLSAFVQKLRAIPETARVDIIVLTTMALIPMDGKTHVFPRPFDVEKLLARLKSLTGGQ